MTKRKIAKMYEGPFAGDGNVLRLDCGDGFIGVSMKIHLIVHFKSSL